MVELRLALDDAMLDDGHRDATRVTSAPAVDATTVHAVPSAPRFVDSERRWLLPAIFVTVAAVSLTIAAILIGQSSAGQHIVDRAKKAVGVTGTSTSVPTQANGTPIAPLASASFDPEGDNEEHDGEARALIDGDPATTWSTERYNSRTFGIKRGVGVYVDLGGSAKLGQLKVTSPTNAWSATVHVSPTAGGSLEEWGAPVASRDTIAAGETTFDLDGAQGRYVLVWITDLGDGSPARANIGELVVTRD
jgi:hypothetical protein